VNHAERPGVLSIAFTLLHVVGNEDRGAELYLDAGPTLWSAGWRERTGVRMDLIGRGTPMETAEQVRIGDLDAWREYQTAVFARTERALASLPVSRLEAPGFATPRKLDENQFLYALVGDRDPRVIDVVEAFMCAHATRHLGELEHARAHWPRRSHVERRPRARACPCSTRSADWIGRGRAVCCTE